MTRIQDAESVLSPLRGAVIPFSSPPSSKPPFYSREVAMEANLRSMTETGKVLRSIGKSEGAPRAGRKAVETVWKLVEQDRPQADIKQVMVTAAKMAATSNRRTITPDLIQSADEIVRNIRKR